MRLSDGLHVQPLLLLRTRAEASARAATDLQFGGYLVTKAFSDDFALWMVHSLPADGLVIDVGFQETLASVACARELEVPTLVLSSNVALLRRMIPDVCVVPRNLDRHELIAAIDRVLVDALTRDYKKCGPNALRPADTLANVVA